MFYHLRNFGGRGNLKIYVVKNQIWATLNNLKFKGFYLSFIVEKFQRWDRNINIFLALTSSGSIAAWAIWNQNPMIWATIIALSQVMTVIKPYFPYFKYVKELNAKCYRIENLNVEIEKLWFKITSDKISEEDAAEEYFEIKKQMVEIFNFNDDTIFGETKKIEKKANERMRIFLKNEYQITINTN